MGKFEVSSTNFVITRNDKTIYMNHNFSAICRYIKTLHDNSIDLDHEDSYILHLETTDPRIEFLDGSTWDINTTNGFAQNPEVILEQILYKAFKKLPEFDDTIGFDVILDAKQTNARYLNFNIVDMAFDDEGKVSTDIIFTSIEFNPHMCLRPLFIFMYMLFEDLNVGELI